MRIFRYSIPREVRAFEAYCRSREERFSPEVVRKVTGIVSGVRNSGDRALLEYTRRFDCVSMRAASIRVPFREMASAWKGRTNGLRKRIHQAGGRVADFEEHAPETADGFLGARFVIVD